MVDGGWDAADKALTTSLSGRRAERWTLGIAQFHREPGTPGHKEAAQYVTQELERYPFDTVERRPYPWDGKARFADAWYSVAAWTPRKGVLRLTHPHEMLLCDFDEIPVVLGIRSGPTPLGGQEYEVVYVGRGITAADYEGQDVRGKMVLTEANGQLGPAVMDMARERGAAGVLACNLIDVPHISSRLDRADLIPHLWTTYWWLGTDHDWAREIFSFSLSHRQVLYLKELLAQGSVRVHAELGPGTVDQVSAVIRGSEAPESEFIYLGHLDHPWPGAWDNASGCGACMEVGAAFALAIRDGKLPRPRRSIRIFLDVHLMGGLMWGSDHPGWTNRAVGAISIDGVGLGTGIREVARPLALSRTAYCNPSYINDVIEFCLQESVDRRFRSAHLRYTNVPPMWPYTISPWGAGGDRSALNELSLGVPAIGMSQMLSATYHTDQDAMGLFDPQEFERACWIASIAGWTLANLSRDEVPVLAMLVRAGARRRLVAEVAQQIEQIRRLLSSGESERAAKAVDEATRRLASVKEREATAIASVGRLDASVNIDKEVDEARRELRDLAIAARRDIERLLDANGVAIPTVLTKTELEWECDRLIPVRRWQGPWNNHDTRRILSERLSRAETGWITEFQGSVPYPSLSFSGLPPFLLGVDGKLSILEIADRVMFEHGSAPVLEVILRLLRQMETAGLVELRLRQA